MLSTICLCLCAWDAWAVGGDTASPWPKSLPGDAKYESPKSLPKLEFRPIREQNTKMRRRVWRRLDTRQKLNNYFTWPGQALNQVVYELATKGKVNAYNNDSFARVYAVSAIREIGKAKVTTYIHNWRKPNDPTDLIDTSYWETFDWKRIVKFEIMEDWIFDAMTGEYIPRIIAIAPLMEVKGDRGSKDVPMFWMKMDELRPDFVKRTVQTKDGMKTTLTWDDLFNKYRLFDGYIVKQTSWDQGYINSKAEYAQNGVAALLQAEDLKNDLFIFDHDLWEY